METADTQAAAARQAEMEVALLGDVLQQRSMEEAQARREIEDLAQKAAALARDLPRLHQQVNWAAHEYHNAAREHDPNGPEARKWQKELAEATRELERAQRTLHELRGTREGGDDA